MHLQRLTFIFIVFTFILTACKEECEDLAISEKGLTGEITQINNQPVINADIFLTSFTPDMNIENRYSASSSLSGSYFFRNIPSGEYYLSYLTECEEETVFLVPGIGPIDINECSEEIVQNITGVEFVPLSIEGLDVFSVGFAVIRTLTFDVDENTLTRTISIRNLPNCLNEDVEFKINPGTDFLTPTHWTTLQPGSGVQRDITLKQSAIPPNNTGVSTAIFIEVNSSEGTDYIEIDVDILN